MEGEATREIGKPALTFPAVHHEFVNGNRVCSFIISINACHSTCAVAVGWTDLMFFSFVAEIMAAMKSHCASMIVGPLERAVGAGGVSARAKRGIAR